MNFSHSGCLGDIIYSIPVVLHYGGGDFYIKLDNVANVIRKYNNGPVPNDYVGRLTQDDFKMIAPLLESQNAIDSVRVFNGERINVDLDEFRRVAGQAFTGNFIQTYCKAFNIPCRDEDVIKPWLWIDEPKPIAKFVVCRSPRYRSAKSTTIPTWVEFLHRNNVMNNGVFVGLPNEHDEFQRTFDIKIPYYECNDFLELAQVIAGSEMFIGNQTFAYGIAQGLQKTTLLEALSYRPLHQNECFFQRTDCYYF